MNNDTFQWNDALVKEYLSTRLGDTYKDLEHFKQSKISKKVDGLIGVGIKGNIVDYNNSASIKIVEGNVTAIAMDGQIFLPEKKTESEQPKKERIEVKVEGTFCIRNDAVAYMSDNIPASKFPAIKAAIERVLNDEDDNSEAVINEYIMKLWRDSKLYPHLDKLMMEAEEKAFNYAQEYCKYKHFDSDQEQYYKLPTFQDYLNSKK